MILKDSDHRILATDPSRSFIVQAPAGSGKTEILTQRFLRLLATVQAPEQIIALTFTRKAANEMRERILIALQKAENQIAPQSAHQQRTYEYACQALERDKTLNWQLVQQPNRLRILTIDSLCQRLVEAIPLQEKQVPFATIADKPQQFYTLAAKQCLDFALQHSAYHEPLKQLLHHLDNQPQKLLHIFAELLANRDQWLGPIHQAKFQNKEAFEQALEWIEEHELTRFYQSLPLSIWDELITLVQKLAKLETAPLCIQEHFGQTNQVKKFNRHNAAGLASLLLTTQGTFRKRFDHHVGLKKGVCTPSLYQDLKSGSEALFETLHDHPDFLDALKRVQNLPAPQYDEHQWAVLQALFALLPILAAHLQLVFNEANKLDFSAISQQAILALGAEEEPTDLALYLDHQIHHLLVDEFQDTSIQQFELLEKLVKEWLPGDGKTLFVVGDPMQSIYRFRSAEVGLFLRAQQVGIGPVKLTALELTCNFRSTATVVEWINDSFQSVFPKTDDIESGAVKFYPSEKTQPPVTHSFIKTWQYSTPIEEARAVVATAKAELETHTTENIAILVRSRTQLKHIVRLLREEQIPFQGIDIDPLANLSHLRDVWSLTQSLLMPANRLAWLSFLRSPWCGISLKDLHHLAIFAKSKSIFYALSQVDVITALSTEGKTRCKFIYQVMDHALNTRYQYPLVEWITTTLVNLHQTSLLTEEEQADLEQFWYLINQFEAHGQISNWEQFAEEFNKLYSQQVTPSRLQIMTIHKSKGLEFDAVILPGLSSKSQTPDKPLLRWLKLPTKERDLLLISPMKALHQDVCLVYDYLQQLDYEKDRYETQRLLYVAVTRSKKRLYLLDHEKSIPKGSFRHLLQHVSFEEQVAIDDRTASSDSIMELPKLYQLPIEYYRHELEPSENPYSNLRLNESLNTARLIGIAAHELLQWICTNHPSSSEVVPWSILTHYFASHGFSHDETTSILTPIKNQICRLFNEPVGQWLISKHEEEQNEYELMVIDGEETTTKIIDRTFLENGKRWVIDFKTGLEDSTSINKHKEQVNHYAHILTTRFQEPIECGLYYLTSGHWISWNFPSSLLQSDLS